MTPSPEKATGAQIIRAEKQHLMQVELDLEPFSAGSPHKPAFNRDVGVSNGGLCCPEELLGLQGRAVLKGALPTT